MDDQPILTQLVCEYLEDDLHSVATALNGSEALEKFRAGHFDLVITDHSMAGMTGEQLAIAIRESNPNIPVILLTGNAAEKNYSPAINLVLGKPLSRSALRQALAKVMAVD